MVTATLPIDILTRNILKPTRSLYDFVKKHPKQNNHQYKPAKTYTEKNVTLYYGVFVARYARVMCYVSLENYA